MEMSETVVDLSGSGEGGDAPVIHISDEGDDQHQDNARNSTSSKGARIQGEVSTVADATPEQGHLSQTGQSTLGSGSGKATDSVETVKGASTTTLEQICSEIPFSKTAPCFDQTVSVMRRVLRLSADETLLWMFFFCPPSFTTLCAPLSVVQASPGLQSTISDDGVILTCEKRPRRALPVATPTNKLLQALMRQAMPKSQPLSKRKAQAVSHANGSAVNTAKTRRASTLPAVLPNGT